MQRSQDMDYDDDDSDEREATPSAMAAQQQNYYGADASAGWGEDPAAAWGSTPAAPVVAVKATKMESFSTPPPSNNQDESQVEQGFEDREQKLVTSGSDSFEQPPRDGDGFDQDQQYGDKDQYDQDYAGYEAPAVDGCVLQNLHLFNN